MENKALDHFVHTINNFEKAVGTIKNLGFNVLPKAQHLELGSANCVIQFNKTYYELVDLSNGLDWLVAPYQQRMEYGEGLTHVSLNSANLEEDRAHLSLAGLHPDEIISARRKILMPDGTENETDSDCFYVWRKDNPYLSLFVSIHKKPETIFIPEYQEHPNGVLDIKKIVFHTTLLEADKAYFKTHYGKEPDILDEEGFAMVGARGDISEVLTTSKFKREYGQLAHIDLKPLKGLPKVVVYEVADLAQTKKLLEQNKVPYLKLPNGLGVHEDNAHGCAQIFKPKHSIEP